MYLNPKERARRDLENRHGDNIVKLAQASAERLNSTLEAQLENLGMSMSRSSTIRLSLSPTKKSPSGKKQSSGMLPPLGRKLQKNDTLQPERLEQSFARIREVEDDLLDH